MNALTTICGIIMIVAAVFLVVAVLLQNGKSHGLSGAITGGAETFFGKTKGRTIDKILDKATIVVAIVFVILVILVYVFQKDYNTDQPFEDYLNGANKEALVDLIEDDQTGEEVEETAAPEAETTAAPETTTAA